MFYAQYQLKFYLIGEVITLGYLRYITIFTYIYIIKYLHDEFN